MAEITFKSAGVKTREIDLSQPSRTGPVGIPAGIIGTSLEGPAFVPLTFANFSDFTTTFGNSDGEKFGPIAVNQWLANAQAVTYMRVLGVGNGLQRSNVGQVTNAGFTVGNRIIQENGLLGDNAFSTESATAAVEGRTYFLGCFMSESNGSTVFSEAGIQGTAAPTSATLVDAIDIAGIAAGDKFTITVPADSGGDGLVYTVLFDTTTNIDSDSGARTYGVSTQRIADDNDGAAVLILAINGQNDPGSQYKYGNNDHSDSGFEFKIPGITASTGTSSSKITLTMDAPGPRGNVANVLAAVTGFEDALLLEAAFTGGTIQNQSVPILRGVLLAPSGVILHLSGNHGQRSQPPTKGTTARSSNNVVMGRKGSLTGSLNTATQEFVMLMNGYNNSDQSKKTHITASFDMTAPNYFANVFNTNPYKIEEEGHLLYGHYDIYPDLAAVTGSGTIKTGRYSGTTSHEDIALLLTSSVARGATAANKPIYEDFSDRFSHAKTPFVISQAFGNSPKSLFRIHLLSAGAGVSDKYKFSIENIRKSSSSTSDFGTFDLLVRGFDDTDEEPKVLESFRGLSLNRGSDRYIGRVVGDQHIFYNFDVAKSSQKLIVDGNHPVRSRYIRVEMHDDIESGNIDKSALPMGFRGPDHLVTSGSLLSNEKDSLYTVSTAVQSLVELPIPYRRTVSVGTGLSKKVDGRFFWGVNTVRQTSATQPNLPSLFDKSFNTYTKHFPNHRIGHPNFSVGNNPGAADIGGTVLDCDRFNNNKFTLENVLVRTGSDTLADPEYWLSASYQRSGVTANATNKTRAFSVDDLGKVSNTKFAKFTFIAQGGFDGVNMFDEEKSKLTNTAVYREVTNDEGSASVANNTVSAYRKAVEVMNSKTDVDIQVLAVPGIRHSSVTDFAIQKIEDRFDAIYIMDIEERDQVNTVITSSVQKPHVANTVTSFKNRALDSSFAAAYFPDVIVKDPSTNTLVQVPPSVAVLGAYSLNDRVAHPWFAPAGFARGALNSVEMASVRLNRSNLDDLYEADINPITAFPGTGVTIWGQKTLQVANSALDRINVRRLLISIRRKVRNVANSLLFEPNRVETLEKFTSLVNPILQRVQEQSGIDRYKAVIDTSTTTQADVENNTIRGKIFIQPTRSVEFVALDFVVTNAGSNI